MLLACQSTPEQSPTGGPAPENTRAAVLQHHDALMARLNGLVQEQLRSKGQLKTLARDTAPEALRRPEARRLRRLLGGLRAAEEAMMTWMHQYQEPDTARLTAHQYEDFWATEAEELRALDRLMSQALDSARTVR
ncbi:hypothetical protein DLM85_07225 [Hymenobacter edaphi]|uniref:Viral A-type inclusion protein n=1 Tax=Hymenobacter edaphi TaxID=2211146 RepID=A0A328BXQ3_9BACT|nr:hypothetical protein DLM85_07225 [Hymenobacter edaphi]